MKGNEKNEKDLQLLGQLGGKLVLLLNRGFMYQPNHPYFVEGVDTTFQALEQVLGRTSPLVFILNREQFYVDEALVDSRINTQKVLSHFKKKGIESVAFYQGVKREDLRVFLEVVTGSKNASDAASIEKELYRSGIDTIRINHVVYRRVTADDEVISREALKMITPEIMHGDQEGTRQGFLDTVLQGVLGEEYEKALNLQHILKEPENFSKEMIAVDLKFAGQEGDEKQPPGQYLLRKLESLQREAEKTLTEETPHNLPDVVGAFFDIRQKLRVEAQKAGGVAYSNERSIFEKADEIADGALIHMVREEYKAGVISGFRLARALRKLIPEEGELKRVLPQIRDALIAEGMEEASFLILLQDLCNELQNEGLASVFTGGPEGAGIGGVEIVEGERADSVFSAELLHLASEIRKEGIDEKALTDLLVGCVERAGSNRSKDISPDEKGSERHLRQITTEIKSDLIRHLGEMNIKEEVLILLEERLNQRMEDVLAKMWLEWTASQSVHREQKPAKRLTLLETLEYSVRGDEELEGALAVIRSKVEAQEIDECDFRQIYEEIGKQEKSVKAKQDDLPAGIMRSRELLAIIDKEIARAKRYGTPFSALGFSLVKAKPKNRPKPEQVSKQEVIDAVLRKLSEIFRSSDVVGQMKANRLVALLPMTHGEEAKLALRRAMRLLHLGPVHVQDIPFEVKVAGVVVDMDVATANALQFGDTLSVQLTDMATRISNIHVCSS